MRPTFAGFSVAKRGLDAARAQLSITGQNMSNAETPGYSRQRVDLNSIGAMGWQTRYASTQDPYIGEGVNIRGISQIRDPYLDVRFRRENTKTANTSTQLESLNELQYIFDEIAKDGMDAQFSDLVTQLQNLSSKKGDPVAESIVKTSALMLVKMFNSMSTRVNNVKKEETELLQTSSVGNANELIKGIAAINEEIKSANIVGNPALELLDSRNAMIDELSGIMNIERSSKLVDVGGGIKVEEVSIHFVGANGDKFNLIDNDKYRQLSIAMDANNNVQTPVRIILNDSSGLPAGGSTDGMVSLDGGDITSEISSGELFARLKMLNSAGEFDNPPTKERGIQYYEKMLDTLAAEFSRVMNTANSTNTVNPANPQYDKPLFESKDGNPINAGNIKISDKWNNTQGSYLTSYKPDPANPGEETDNVLCMIDLMTKDFNFTAPGTGVPLFKGSFQGCYTNLSLTLGLEMKDIGRQNDANLEVLLDVDSQRSSVSGVNLDEEGINLIQYNQSLTAASRFMTTLDEAVDVIINRMGIVGR